MKILSENRKARFDYEILETYEAGIELLGFEVKSVKNGQINLTGSYGIIRKGEVWLLNAQIPPYQPKNTPPDYEPSRSRRLLLNRDEINRILGKLNDKSLKLVPLEAHLKNNLIKIKLGLCRNRKKHDKREVLKKKDITKEIRREK